MVCWETPDKSRRRDTGLLPGSQWLGLVLGEMGGDMQVSAVRGAY